MKISSNKRLIILLSGLAVAWLVAAYALGRNSFTWSAHKPFDWAGLIFTILSLGIAYIGIGLLKKSQKRLRYNYLWYGMLWLIPLVFLTSGVGNSRSEVTADYFATDHAQCPPQIFPRVCRNSKQSVVIDSHGQQAVVPAGTTFQSGYAVMFVLYGGIVFAIYKGAKTRIKGYKREELFQ